MDDAALNHKIFLSVSKYVVNKLPKVKDEDSEEVKSEKRKRWAEFTRSFKNAQMTVEELCQHIHAGYSISAELTAEHRSHVNFKSSQILGVDFDTEDSRSSIEALKHVPFIANNALLIHTTASHRPEKPRARVLFLLNKRIVNADKYVEYEKAILRKFKFSDQQVNDPARLWFGAQGCEIEIVGKTLDIAELSEKSRASHKETEEQFKKFGDPVPEGERNNHAFHYALQFARAGLGEDQIVDLLVKNWEKLGYHAPKDELRYATQSAMKRVQEGKDRAIEPTLRNDDDNARRLLKEYGEDIIYVTGIGWFTWTGKVWEFDDDNARLRVMASETMRRIRDEALEDAKDKNIFREAMARAQWATNSMNVGRLNAMIDQASKYPQVRRRIDQIDPIEETKFLLNFMNGTLDLKSGVLMDHDKTMMITKIIPHNYVIEADCPTWMRTLELGLGGNQNLIKFMQRALGYTLSGSVKEKCLFICHGEQGDNAKSTIFEAIRYTLGPDYTIMSSVDVITNKDNSNYVLASLAQMAGIRMVHMNEAEQTQSLSEALVKQMTGGDMIQTKKMRMDPIEFQPVFKLWIRANGLPRIRGTDNAIWSRVKRIPFVTIPVELRRSRDEIDTLLHDEVEGILTWIVAGFKEWDRDGLGDPPEIKRATDEYRSENDLVQQFMDEHVLRGGRESTSDLYSAFCKYMELVGTPRHGINQMIFTRRLRAIAGVDTSKSNGKMYMNEIHMSEQSKMELGIF